MKRLLLISNLLLAVLTIGAQQYRIPVSEEHEKMQTGKYEPTWQSLETHQTPEWFRNAKFGIWAHWGAQCVEGSGDWMARNCTWRVIAKPTSIASIMDIRQSLDTRTCCLSSKLKSGTQRNWYSVTSVAVRSISSFWATTTTTTTSGIQSIRSGIL